MQTVVNNILKFNIPAEELSKRSTIPLLKLQSILSENVDPSIGDLTLIANALKVPLDFLISNSETYQSVEALFRKKPESLASSIIDRVSYIISNALSLLEGQLPNMSVINSFPIVENTYEEVLKLSTIFRQRFYNSDFLSPILTLPEIISNQLNCILLTVELGNQVDGASAVINGIPFILISPRFKPRMMFTLAHELGHIIAHHRDSNNFATLDVNSFNYNQKNNGEESFAHAFASEILLPQEGVAQTLQVLRRSLKLTPDYFGEIELLYLSRIYGVSFEAAALRCENLGILPRGGAVGLYESLKKEFGGPEKRAEQLQLPGRPEIYFPKVSSNLLKPVVNKINSGKMSLGRAAELLGITTSELFQYNALTEWT